MDEKKMYRILDICSSLEDVRTDVLKNHDNNLWWPIDISDYRKRLLIAGLSTRISYNMIETYQKFIKKIDVFSYEQLLQMSDENLMEIIKSLGLSKARLKYIKSMSDFINKWDIKLFELSNDELIELIAKNVNGASYKVAQCCAVYIKDYHCNVMPVDSGLKDMTLPCIGFAPQKQGIGHEYSRKELESIVNKIEVKSLINKNDYQQLNIPEGGPYNWWAHLVLIYYKRHYCNKHKPELCPLNRKMKVLEKCKR